MTFTRPRVCVCLWASSCVSRCGWMSQCGGWRLQCEIGYIEIDLGIKRTVGFKYQHVQNIPSVPLSADCSGVGDLSSENINPRIDIFIIKRKPIQQPPTHPYETCVILTVLWWQHCIHHHSRPTDSFNLANNTQTSKWFSLHGRHWLGVLSVTLMPASGSSALAGTSHYV